jgi:hypothetical protein
MAMNIRTKGLTLGVALSVLILGSPVTSSADDTIDTCQATCETNCADGGSGPNCHEAVSGRCTLIDDLTCSSTTTASIRLRDGTDLDMNGHTITCAANVDCTSAVEMNAANSKVINLDPGEAEITGGYVYGVNCGLTSGSEVTGIKITNTIVGAQDCKTVKNNVITGLGRLYIVGNWGVTTNGVSASGDVISQNYIADKYTGVLVYGDDAVEVSENTIQTTSYGVCGVQLYSAGSTADVLNNIIFGVGQPVFGATPMIFCLNATPPTGADLAGNQCDVDHPDCDDCQDAEHCLPPIAPWVP